MKEKLTEILERLNQTEILKKINGKDKDFSEDKRSSLEKEILSFDMEALLKQKNDFFKKKMYLNEYKGFHPADEDVDISKKKAVSQNHSKDIALVVLAGGMGTRLGEDIPKGMVEITPLTEKSLFENLIDKIKAASKKYNKSFYISFMTSFYTHEKTIAFFKENNFFDLNLDQIDFFMQKDLPFLDERGNLILQEKKPYIIKGPNGNGDVFESLKRSKLLEKYKKNNVKYIEIISIDNPLADPFDEAFINAHISKKAQVSAVGIKKKNEENPSMGFFVKKKEEKRVFEYLFDKEKEIKGKVFNAGIYLFNLSLIDEMDFSSLPYHFIKKEVEINSDNKKIKKSFYKSELFIFDIFNFVKKDISIVLFPEEICFYPLKNKRGKYSKKEVQKALIKKDKLKYKEIFEKDPDMEVLELSKDFYYI